MRNRTGIKEAVDWLFLRVQNSGRRYVGPQRAKGNFLNRSYETQKTGRSTIGPHHRRSNRFLLSAAINVALEFRQLIRFDDEVAALSLFFY